MLGLLRVERELIRARGNPYMGRRRLQESKGGRRADDMDGSDDTQLTTLLAGSLVAVLQGLPPATTGTDGGDVR